MAVHHFGATTYNAYGLHCHGVFPLIFRHDIDAAIDVSWDKLNAGDSFSYTHQQNNGMWILYHHSCSWVGDFFGDCLHDQNANNRFIGSQLLVRRCFNAVQMNI
jgi:hypothetical protein